MAILSFPRGTLQGEQIPSLQSIELFAGAGGLGMGFSGSGVQHQAVVEWSKHACETLRINKRHGVEPIAHWADVTEGDVRQFDFSNYAGLDLITGGPPCQPFSMGGKHRGFLDERDMFPQAVRAIREVRPKAFVFENVKGLTRASFYNYFNYIQLQLEYPSLQARVGEEWLEHLSRLEQHKTAGGLSEYHVVARLVNAADYGVPQFRKRVLIVGVRDDVSDWFKFPSVSHAKPKVAEKLGLLPHASHGEAIKHLPPNPEGEYYERPHDPEGNFAWYFMSRNRRHRWDSPAFTVVANFRHITLHPASPKMELEWRDLANGWKQKWRFTTEYDHVAFAPTFP
ncbi:MAG: DNA (cytosine-5-)-methyltransferase, partial [Cytophagaceae bacterium]